MALNNMLTQSLQKFAKKVIHNVVATLVRLLCTKAWVVVKSVPVNKFYYLSMKGTPTIC